MSHERWRANPIEFIETVLCDPETGQPFVLLDAEREFLAHAFTLAADGRLLYPEQVFGAIKKSGKTGFAALHMLTTMLLFGGSFAEGYVLANDFEQASGRVFQAIKRIVEASPLLRAEARFVANRIEFPELGATISAIASDYAGAAGANPTISTFDELWAYTSEASRRLWDEMVPPPTRKIACRLTVSYAGFTGESVLLEELHKRGFALPEVGPSLHAGDGLLFAWHHEPIAPWQTESWLAEMRRTLRPNAYARMITNEFVSAEFELRRHGSLGRVRSALAHAGAGGSPAARLGRRRCKRKARCDRPGRMYVRQEGEVCSPRAAQGVHADAGRPDRLRDHGRGHAARLEQALSPAQDLFRPVPDGGGRAAPRETAPEDRALPADRP